MTIGKGTKVKIKKGTNLWSTKLGITNTFQAKITYTVILNDFHTGWKDIPGYPDRKSEVVWAGGGGYWTHAKLEDIEVIK